MLRVLSLQKHEKVNQIPNCLLIVVNKNNMYMKVVNQKRTNYSCMFSLHFLYGRGVEKMNYLRCLYKEGDKEARGSGVELTVQIPVTLALKFLRGTHVEQRLCVVE